MGIQSFGVDDAIKHLGKLEKDATPVRANAEEQKTALGVFKALLIEKKGSWFTSKSSLKELGKRVTALSYRLGVTPIKSVDSVDIDIDHLYQSAVSWKNSQISFRNEADLQDNGLTQFQEQQLQQLMKYHDIIPYINLDKFFSWALRNKQSVDIFVQFPTVVDRINKAYLSGRIGVFGGLELVEGDQGEKDVTLLVESNPVSILNEKAEVTFSTGLIRTVKDIFASFADKNYHEGIFTYFKNEGVVPWDSFAMGIADDNGEAKPIEVREHFIDKATGEHISQPKKDWWKGLRMKEYLTAEQATEKFGFECDGVNGVLTLVGTRQVDIKDTFGAHGFFRLAIPLGDGTYAYTYGWGKFSKIYPQDVLDSMTYLFGPVKAAVQYPDNNEVYTHREVLEKHFSLPSDQTERWVESLRQDIEYAQDGKLIFQILLWNCTNWLIKKVRKFSPEINGDMMRINYKELQPSGCFGALMSVVRKVCDCCAQFLLNVVGFMLGNWQSVEVTKVNGKVKEYHVGDKAWNERANDFQHPGQFFDTFAKKEIPEEVGVS